MADLCGPGEHCITCGDIAAPMEVIEVHDGAAACRDERGAVHAVAVELVEHPAVGDLLLVHAGVAISRLEPAR
jgi:hydrogenase expression/formation protein HypC